jgi:hypothetical protein
VDCAAALSLPSSPTANAKVASATDGAAPNRPAKLFGLKRSPKRANVETDTPPIRKRINISFIGPAIGSRELRHRRAAFEIGGVVVQKSWLLSRRPASQAAREYREDRIIHYRPRSYKLGMNANREPEQRDNRFESTDERSPELKGDLEAQLDDLGDDPAQVGENSAGQSVSSLGLSDVRDSNEESVEELSDADQALEAASVEGVEDAADHPERPTHTHEEYGNPEDVPPRKRNDAA